MAIGAGGYPPSPMGQFPPISHAGMGRMVDVNPTMSPHNLSPKGTGTSASVNGFNSQVTETRLIKTCFVFLRQFILITFQLSFCPVSVISNQYMHVNIWFKSGVW